MPASSNNPGSTHPSSAINAWPHQGWVNHRRILTVPWGTAESRCAQSGHDQRRGRSAGGSVCNGGIYVRIHAPGAARRPARKLSAGKRSAWAPAWRTAAKQRIAWKAALVPVTVAVIACQLVLTGPVSATRVGTQGQQGGNPAPGRGSEASAGIMPKTVNEVDCNGWSPKYKS